MACPICQSSDLIHVSRSTSITKKWRKVTGAPQYEESGIRNYPVEKYACLGCGAIFEQLSDNVLKDILNDRPCWCD